MSARIASKSQKSTEIIKVNPTRPRSHCEINYHEPDPTRPKLGVGCKQFIRPHAGLLTKLYNHKYYKLKHEDLLCILDIELQVKSLNPL